MASLHSIFIPSSIESYALPTAKIIPEKTVMVSVVQKQEHQGEYGEQKYTFYCEVEDLEYEVNDRGKLQSLIINCLDIFRKYKDSEYYLPHYTKELGDNINYIAKLSTYIIYYLYLNNRIKGCVDLLATKNLEKRFETIELILSQFLCNQKKGAKYSFFSKANEFIKEVSEIPKGFSLVLFYGEVEKYLSLSTFEEHNKCGLSILDSEQIERNYYNNDKTVLLVRESLGDFDPKSIVPSVLARVNNILIKENNKANIYLSPEKRVRVTEIVEKDGVFYGSAKEIVEPKPNSREELDKLKQLVEKLIKAYQRKDYQGSRKYSDSKIPIFNSALVNFETYAANLSFYIADNIFGYNSPFDKNVSREFCSKSTIEKLTYLIEYIESSKKTPNLTTATSTDIDTSTFTTSEQWLELGKSRIQTDSQEAINHFNNATQLDSNNAEAWYFKAKSFDKIKKFNQSLKCFEKALSLNLDDIYRHETLTHVIPQKIWSKEYKEALRYNSELLKLRRSIVNLEVQAKLYSRLEKYQEALKCCDEIAALDNSYDSILSFKGDILFALDKLEEAMECYGQVIALKCNE